MNIPISGTDALEEEYEKERQQEVLSDIEDEVEYDEYESIVNPDGKPSKAEIEDISRRAWKDSAAANKLNQYSLWRNLVQTINDPDSDKPPAERIHDWTYKYISPAERNCVIKQTTQCASYGRVKRLRDKLVNPATLPTAESLSVKDYEIISLASAEVAHYRSYAGSYMNKLSKLSLEGGLNDVEELKLNAELDKAGEEFSKFIEKLVEFLEIDKNIEYLFPESELKSSIVRELKQAFSDSKTYREKSLELRKSVLKDRIFREINITPSEVKETLDSLKEIVKAAYSQRPSTKRMNTLYQKRGLFTCEKTYDFIHDYVNSVEVDYNALSNYTVGRFGDNITKRIDEIGEIAITRIKQISKTTDVDQDVQDDIKKVKDDIYKMLAAAERDLNFAYNKLKIERREKINAAFADYSVRNNKTILFGNMVWADVIPNPLVISTYPVDVDLHGEDTSNMFMWPDRIALSYQPENRAFASFSPSLVVQPRLQIYSDLHDPTINVGKPEITFENPIMNTSILNLLYNNGLKSMSIMSDQYRGKHRNSPDKSKDFDESWTIEEMKFLNDCGRTVNPDHPEATAVTDGSYVSGAKSQTLEDSISTAYIQYANKLARGYSQVLDDRVYCGIGPKEFVDPVTGQRQKYYQDGGSSEFTYYSQDVDQSSGKAIYSEGSYVTVKYDVSPHISTKRTGYFLTSQQKAQAAGHSLYLDMKKRNDRKFIWFKATNKARKGKKSTKVEKEIKDDRWNAWFVKAVEVDAVCENSERYQWDHPEYMVLLFKAIAGAIYEIGEDRAGKFLLMVRLNKLKRLGDVRENAFVYNLRRYLDFALAIDQSLQKTEHNDATTGEPLPPFYKNSDAKGWYDYDFVIEEQTNIYSKWNAEDGAIDDTLIENDTTSPILFRAMPTVAELWKLFQLYFKMLFSGFGNNYAKLSVYDFMYTDVDMVSGNMKKASNDGVEVGKKFTKKLVQRLKNDAVNPLEQDSVADLPEALQPTPNNAEDEESTPEQPSSIQDASSMIKIIMQNITTGISYTSSEPVFVDMTKKKKNKKTEGLLSGGIAISLWRMLNSNEKRTIQVYLFNKQKGQLTKFVSGLYAKYGFNPSRVIDFIDEIFLSDENYAYPEPISLDENDSVNLYVLAPSRVAVLARESGMIESLMDKILVKFKNGRKADENKQINELRAQIAKANLKIQKLRDNTDSSSLTRLRKLNGRVASLEKTLESWMSGAKSKGIADQDKKRQDAIKDLKRAIKNYNEALPDPENPSAPFIQDKTFEWHLTNTIAPLLNIMDSYINSINAGEEISEELNQNFEEKARDFKTVLAYATDQRTINQVKEKAKELKKLTEQSDDIGIQLLVEGFEDLIDSINEQQQQQKEGEFTPQDVQNAISEPENSSQKFIDISNVKFTRADLIAFGLEDVAFLQDYVDKAPVKYTSAAPKRVRKPEPQVVDDTDWEEVPDRAPEPSESTEVEEENTDESLAPETENSDPVIDDQVEFDEYE